MLWITVHMLPSGGKTTLKRARPAAERCLEPCLAAKQHIVRHRDTVIMWWGQLLTAVKRVQYGSKGRKSNNKKKTYCIQNVEWGHFKSNSCHQSGHYSKRKNR